jgi:hypothetical protein
MAIGSPMVEDPATPRIGRTSALFWLSSPTRGAEIQLIGSVCALASKAVPRKPAHKTILRKAFSLFEEINTRSSKMPVFKKLILRVPEGGSSRGSDGPGRGRPGWGGGRAAFQADHHASGDGSSHATDDADQQTLGHSASGCCGCASD